MQADVSNEIDASTIKNVAFEHLAVSAQCNLKSVGLGLNRAVKTHGRLASVVHVEGLCGSAKP